MSEEKLSQKESKLKRQIDRYRRKTQPVILARFLTVRHETMVKRYREYALTAQRLEEIVQKVTEEARVPAVYRLWYLNFAREVEEAYRRYQHRHLSRELTIVQFKWASRGLNPLRLKQIETAIEQDRQQRAGDKMKNWKITPPEYNYAKDRYTAPHCLRYLAGYFYNFYVEAINGYETHIVRSKDLIHWESSPLNPVMRASAEDKKIANPNLSEELQSKIANAENINNSDIDFCEFNGRLIIYYSWGNQQGIEFLAEAIYDGSGEQFLRGWFPKTS